MSAPHTVGVGYHAAGATQEQNSLPQRHIKVQKMYQDVPKVIHLLCQTPPISNFPASEISDHLLVVGVCWQRG